MSSVVLIEPRTVPRNGLMIKLGRRKQARLWAPVPLYKEELEWKLKDGFKAVEKLFDRLGINEVLDPARLNVATHKWGPQ
jgi:hypothetical protein